MQRLCFGLTALMLASCAELEREDEHEMPATELALAANPTAPSLLGFENPAEWSLTQGVKGASSVRTEGAASLAFGQFTFTDLISAPLSTLDFVTSTMALDLTLPAPTNWGEVELFVSIPSRNVHNQTLGKVSLVGKPAGSFQTLNFQVPSPVLTALKQTYSDLSFKVTVNAPFGNTPFLIDNLRFTTGSTEPSVVTLNVGNVDDFVYVTVNGVRRQVVPVAQSAALDVTDWFHAGTNTVRLQAINTGGPASYFAQLVVDGRTAIDEQCANAPCDPNVVGGIGILFDKTYQVDVRNRPAASELTVQGSAGAKIYLNDVYTGQSAPASFRLPQGSYTVGLGVGEGGPGAYEGSFYEQTVALGASPLTVTPTAGAPLGIQNRTRVAILPIRRTIHGEGGELDTGILTDRDIELLAGQALVTRDEWVEPFSYGLTTWDVTVLPTVETTPLRRAADKNSPPDTTQFLIDAQLTHLNQQYDSVVFYFSKDTASGAEVAHSPCCWWGIGQMVAFPNHSMRDAHETPNRPNVVLLHEMLHDYESYNDWRLHYYNGAEGDHGAAVHGYPKGANGEFDFLLYYRDFMRGQVAELNTMRGFTEWNGPRPTQADLWAGLFDTFRRGVSWHEESADALRTTLLTAEPAPDAAN